MAMAVSGVDGFWRRRWKREGNGRGIGTVEGIRTFIGPTTVHSWVAGKSLRRVFSRMRIGNRRVYAPTDLHYILS